MDVHFTLRGKGRFTRDIYGQLRAAILDGSLRPGARVPPTRDVARRLGVARNTVAAAYERLRAEGFLVGRAGAGTTVSHEAKTLEAPRQAPAGAITPRPGWRHLPATGPTLERPAYDFGLGVPDTRLFPFAEWRRTFARQLRGTGLDWRYGDPAGRADLRAAIARFVAVSRAVLAGPDDVVVTSGAQQALDLIARVLVEPGACVAMEEPGYRSARLLFESHGAKVVPVPVDAEGLDVARLPDAAKLVYVTPSHQFPLGMPLSLERRLALLRWAERRGAVLIEDDYDTELRFAGRPLEPLQCLDRAGRVLYVGTFSKVLLPGLRLGFVVAPPSLRPALVAAKRLADGGSETAGQAALARFIESGALARHVRRMTREYGARRARLEAVLARDFHRWLRVVPGAAGLHLAAVATRKVDLERASRRAAEHGVRVATLKEYAVSPHTQPGLLFGYGAIALPRIEPGLARLLACM